MNGGGTLGSQALPFLKQKEEWRSGFGDYRGPSSVLTYVYQETKLKKFSKGCINPILDFWKRSTDPGRCRDSEKVRQSKVRWEEKVTRIQWNRKKDGILDLGRTLQEGGEE